VKESSDVDQKSTMLQLADLWRSQTRKSGKLVRTLSDFHCILTVPITVASNIQSSQQLSKQTKF
jgi:hypothetical protein